MDGKTATKQVRPRVGHTEYDTLGGEKSSRKAKEGDQEGKEGETFIWAVRGGLTENVTCEEHTEMQGAHPAGTQIPSARSLLPLKAASLRSNVNWAHFLCRVHSLQELSSPLYPWGSLLAALNSWRHWRREANAFAEFGHTAHVQ